MRRNRPQGATQRRLALLWLCALWLPLSGCESNPAIDLHRSDVYHEQRVPVVRVMSWNVKRNSILPPDGARRESFARIVRAVAPDVIALQEVMWPDLDARLTQLMDQYVPLEDGRSWHVQTVSDNALISRYPMRWRDGELSVLYPIPRLGLANFHYGFASALVELPEAFSGKNLLVVAMHNKSGADRKDVLLRQVQADSTVRWLRELADSAEDPAIVDCTPVVILGDMNVVPDASTSPFETLLSGDIADEYTFGPDFRIDWDGTDMADARPSHNGLGREFYTWRNDDLPFEPSALDRILFSDSVMSFRQGFVLNTITMSASDLANHGLRKSDVLYGGDPNDYDHLPLVVDFAIDSMSLNPRCQ